MLGGLCGASEFSRNYAMNREAFGRPIAHHQGLAFLIVDMYTAVESVRLLVHDAALKIDRGEDGVQEAAAAFVEAVEAYCTLGEISDAFRSVWGEARDFGRISTFKRV